MKTIICDVCGYTTQNLEKAQRMFKTLRHLHRNYDICSCCAENLVKTKIKMVSDFLISKQIRI